MKKFKNSKKRKLRAELKALKIDRDDLIRIADDKNKEISRLTSKNTVMVQSIENLVKEANLVLAANENGKTSAVCDSGFYLSAEGKPEKIVKFDMEAIKSKCDGNNEPVKEWVPQVGDICEVIGDSDEENGYLGNHNIPYSTKVSIVAVDYSDDSCQIAENRYDTDWIFNKDLKFISRPDKP